MPLLVIAGLVALATVIGLVWRARDGRERRLRSSDQRPFGELELNAAVTLVQFSSPVCAPCVATHRVLSEIAASRTDVAHVEFDVSEHPELAARHQIMQTPTTLVLDADGSVRARIGGAARRDVIVAQLDRVLV